MAEQNQPTAQGQQNAGQTSPQASSQTDAVFEFESYVRYSEVDHRSLLTPPALINYFQDCSTFQSEKIGCGMAWLKERRKAWVLSHWQVVVDRYPSLCEPIAVGTFAGQFKGLTATRFFYLRDAGGSLVARAKSSWAFIDLEKGRPVRPTPEHTDPYGTHEALDMPAEGRKVAVPDILRDCEPVIVRRYHIDTNEHVNNCQYVQMALELLPRETSPSQIRVDYRRAAVLGDVIYPRIAQETERTVVELADKNGSPFAVVELQ